MNDYFISIKQKDDLILNLKFNLNQYSIDLSKANETIIHCENKILALYNEILYLDNCNKNLQSLIQKDSKNYQVNKTIFLSLFNLL